MYVQDLGRSVEFERELSSLKDDVVKIIVNTLKERDLYDKFRKHYTRWSFTMKKRPYFNALYHISPFTPKTIKNDGSFCLTEFLADYENLTNSFIWDDTPEGRKWDDINDLCASKIDWYLRREIANENSKINKFKRKYGFR